MQTTWQQKEEAQIYYSTATFRCLLDSLARPGKINSLQYPSFWGEPPLAPPNIADSNSTHLNLYALGALLTLLDSEVGFGIGAKGLWLDQNAEAVRWLTLRSGSHLSAPNVADFAFFCNGSSGGLLAELNEGNLLEPELSTTAFYCVKQLGQGELTLNLSGPGIATTTILSLSGLDETEIELIQQTRHDYPLGIDLYLVDEAGRCVGLPRTTRISN